MQTPSPDFFSGKRHPVYGRYGAAATSHPLASAEALSVLRAGGSAADACIAACAVQCVVEPHMTGIGGDCFVMVKTIDGKPRTLNGSGTTPKALTPTWLKDNKINSIDATSPLAVTIPGAVSAWAQLHKNYGKLPWRGLFQVAIQYAQEGYPVYSRVAHDWAENQERLKQDADAAKIFLPDGKAPLAGTWHKQIALAETFKKIADGGEIAFYHGDIADDIVQKMNALGAPHSKQDFQSYKAQWQQPVHTDFRNWTIWECAPNGQGIIALLMLALMNKQPAKPLDDEGIRQYLEITRIAYTWRDNHLGDNPTFNWQRLIADVEHLKNTDKLTSLPPPEHQDTVYLTAIDSQGLSVSFINSLFNAFGSGIVTPNSGILLHNRGSCFSLEDGHPNQIQGNKRPMHTIIPALATNPQGDVMSFGVMGGHYQAAGQAWFLSRLFDDQCNLQQALDYPRLFNYPDCLEIEPTFPAHWRQQLEASGIPTQTAKTPIGGGQVVMRHADDGLLEAASDTRKDGMAVAF